MSDRYVPVPSPRPHLDPDLCKHGYSTYTDAAGRVHVATGGRCSDVPVSSDAARDARVAARRAADARKAGAALNRLLDDGEGNRPTSLGSIYGRGWHDGYRACAEDYLRSELQHNRHYARPDRCDVRDHIATIDPLTFKETCPNCEQHNDSYARACADPLLHADDCPGAFGGECVSWCKP